jgi:hypothetical protein
VKINTTLLSLILLFLAYFSSHAQIPIPPNWGDIRIGLVNDNNAKINARMKQAVGEGVQLLYRYRYLNGGFDSTSNSMSWMFTQWTDYVKDSDSLAGVEPSFVIYLLQEEGGNAATIANVKNSTKMRQYFGNIRNLATRCNGYQSVFIVEPDTWGYLMQGGYMNPEAISANVSNLGGEFDYLQGLPNNLCGVAQGVIRTVKKYAPDAYVGCLASHWSVISTGWNVEGLVWSTDELINTSIAKNVEWFDKLLGSGSDRGDFIGVEKNGWSAGRWKKYDGRTYWYWGDEQMQKYLRWCKGVAEGLNLPVVGWQISIGHMGLPNVTVETFTDNAYEDTFFPYFFDHVSEFLDAHFIGFLVGKGIADDTDFANETEGEVGDRGWFFSHLKEFDKGRPYLSTPIKKNNKCVNKNSFSMTIKNNKVYMSGFFNQRYRLKVDLYSISGQHIYSLYNNSFSGSSLTIPIVTNGFSSGIYIVKAHYDNVYQSVELPIVK